MSVSWLHSPTSLGECQVAVRVYMVTDSQVRRSLRKEEGILPSLGLAHDGDFAWQKS
jgi:hypothetical protein